MKRGFRKFANASGANEVELIVVCSGARPDVAAWRFVGAPVTGFRLGQLFADFRVDVQVGLGHEQGGDRGGQEEGDQQFVDGEGVFKEQEVECGGDQGEGVSRRITADGDMGQSLL